MSSVRIDGGAAFVFDHDVVLTLQDDTADEMRLRNAGDAWGAWEPYATSKAWTLAAGVGARTVEVEYRYQTGTPWAEDATTRVQARPQMGGQGTDLLDAEWAINRHGGYGAATLRIVPPRGLSRFRDDVNQHREIRDHDRHLVWEGRVEEPDLDYAAAESISMEATGYAGLLDDNEYFRRCYVSNDLAKWQTDQATKYADRFSVGIEDDDKLVMRVSCYGGDPGQVLTGDMNCRAYWQLFDGIDTEQEITAFKFHYQGKNLDSNLECRLYGRDKLSGGTVNRLIWTSPATYDPSGTVSLDDVDIGADVRVLVFIFKHYNDLD